MDHTAPQGLMEHFSKLEDPRVDRNNKHELKREKTKISYRRKRIRAALNDTFRHNLLMGQ